MAGLAGQLATWGEVYNKFGKNLFKNIGAYLDDECVSWGDIKSQLVTAGSITTVTANFPENECLNILELKTVDVTKTLFISFRNESSFTPPGSEVKASFTTTINNNSVDEILTQVPYAWSKSYKITEPPYTYNIKMHEIYAISNGRRYSLAFSLLGPPAQGTVSSEYREVIYVVRD